VSRVRKVLQLASGGGLATGPRTTDLREPSEPQIDRYSMDLRGLLDSGHYELFDEGGVPYRWLDSVGPTYNYTTVASYAIANFQRLGDVPDKAHREAFLTQADFLVSSAEPHAVSGRVWRFRYATESMAEGWISAMSQGQAISVLARAFWLSGQSKYLAAAMAAWPVLTVPVRDGGLLVHFPESEDLCWEEYPTPQPSRVLNGWMHAIWGLADLLAVSHDPDVRVLLDEGVESARRHVGDYDCGWWSTYDLPDAGPSRYASFEYHTTHIWQLSALADRTGIREFQALAERWHHYKDRPWCRARALGAKAVQRLRYGY